MKIRDIEERINASYNTIKKFVEANPEYYEKRNNIIHVTNKGLKELEKKYGVRTDVLTDDNIYFYKNQIAFMKEQLNETQKYNAIFLKQIEMRNDEIGQKERELLDKKEIISKLEEKIHQQELRELELKHSLEIEKNKSIWKKIFRSKGD